MSTRRQFGGVVATGDGVVLSPGGPGDITTVASVSVVTGEEVIVRLNVQTEIYDSNGTNITIGFGIDSSSAYYFYRDLDEADNEPYQILMSGAIIQRVSGLAPGTHTFYLLADSRGSLNTRASGDIEIEGV